jgi:hypothetical protein
MHGVGKGLILLGTLFIGAGILVLIFGKFSVPFGKLPGDIVIRRENFSFYAPISSMILVSVAISLVLNVISRFWR